MVFSFLNVQKLPEFGPAAKLTALSQRMMFQMSCSATNSRLLQENDVMPSAKQKMTMQH